MRKIAVSILLIFLSFSPVLGLQSMSNTTAIVGRDEVIREDLIISGETVKVLGVVNGDVIAMGGDVSVDGVVNGDLIVMAGMVNVSGRVNDDVRVLAGAVNLGGHVEDSTLVFAGLFDLTGSVNGDVKVFSQSSNINGVVYGNVNVNSASVRLGESASIKGGLNTSSEVTGKPSQVAGSINVEEEETSYQTYLKRVFTFFVTRVLSGFLFGLVIIFLGGGFVKDYVKGFQKEFLSNAFYGLLLLIMTPIISFLLIVTIIGAPLGLASLVLFGVLVYSSTVLTSFPVGEWVLEKLRVENASYPLVWELFTGLLAINVLLLIPVLGWVSLMVLSVLSTGVVGKLVKKFFSEGKRQ